MIKVKSKSSPKKSTKVKKQKNVKKVATINKKNTADPQKTISDLITLKLLDYLKNDKKPREREYAPRTYFPRGRRRSGYGSLSDNSFINKEFTKNLSKDKEKIEKMARAIQPKYYNDETLSLNDQDKLKYKEALEILKFEKKQLDNAPKELYSEKKHEFDNFLKEASHKIGDEFNEKKKYLVVNRLADDLDLKVQGDNLYY
jgi:hypothetical protein